MGCVNRPNCCGGHTGSDAIPGVDRYDGVPAVEKREMFVLAVRLPVPILADRTATPRRTKNRLDSSLAGLLTIGAAHSGRVTQRRECHPDTVEVLGSNPSTPISFRQTGSGTVGGATAASGTAITASPIPRRCLRHRLGSFPCPRTHQTRPRTSPRSHYRFVSALCAARHTGPRSHGSPRAAIPPLPCPFCLLPSDRPIDAPGSRTRTASPPATRPADCRAPASRPGRRAFAPCAVGSTS